MCVRACVRVCVCVCVCVYQICLSLFLCVKIYREVVCRKSSRHFLVHVFTQWGRVVDDAYNSIPFARFGVTIN